MKTIKIFLASSEELKDERSEMTDLVYQLNKLFKSRGIELDLERWEYLDASMSNKRKQDEYNDVLKQCDICMVLFWRKFGGFTSEELDVAYRQMKNGEKPQKIYVFFKNPGGDDISNELKDFMQGYEQRYGGHFFCKFHNKDEMKLEFLLQLELYQKGLLGEKVVEVRQERVFVDNEVVADLNNIPFAANNAGFKKMQEELLALRREIAEMQAELEKKQQKQERKKAKMEKDPYDEDYREEYEELREEVELLIDRLQQKLDRKNKLEEDFNCEQKHLFDTARRIMELKGQRISERMVRAIEAFEHGDTQRADAILDEAEHDADEALVDIRAAKQIGVQSLEELMLNAKTKMANDTIPIAERVEATMNIYEKADALAKEVDYDKDKYAKLLRAYGDFLVKRNPRKAVVLFNRQAELLEEIYGQGNNYLARVYDDIAILWKEYKGEENLDKAWDYLGKAIGIKVKHFGEKHPDVAKTYRLMGEVQINRQQYDEAKACIAKAIGIFEDTVGKMNRESALAYGAMGLLYKKLFVKDDNAASFEEAKNCYSLAIEVLEVVEGEEKEETLYTYNNLANLYRIAGEYDKALELHKKSLGIKERVLGFFNLSTAVEYNNMGNVYHDKTNYDEALNCYSKSLKIKEKILNEGDYSFSNTYKRMGITCKAMGNYKDAAKCFSDALQIRQNQLKEGDERVTELREALAECEKKLETL